METQQCGIKPSEICYLGQSGGLDLSTARKRVDALEFRRQEVQREEKKIYILVRTKNPISQIEKGCAALPPCGKLQFLPHGNTRLMISVQGVHQRCSCRVGGHRTQSSAWPLLSCHRSTVARGQTAFPWIWPTHWRY